jgi:guanylate kinase
MNSLIILTGPSASGKTTVGRKIIKKNKKLEKVVTFTTRKKRPLEKPDRDYYFISENEFKKKLSDDEFIEWAKVYNHYYGNSFSELERIWQENKTPLLIIDVQGALAYKEKLPWSKVIFLKPASTDNLAQRIIKRGGGNQTELKTRLETVQKEIKIANKFDYIIPNPEGKLKETIEKVDELIKKIIN